MTRSCAKDLTARINSTSEDLAGMLKRAHDEKAWQALEYPDWKSYVAAELKFSEQRSFQLLDFATIRGELADSTVVESKVLPTSERVTRELKTVPKEQRPVVYAAAVEAAGGQQPTARQVKQAQAKVVEVEVATAPPQSGPTQDDSEDYTDAEWEELTANDPAYKKAREIIKALAEIPLDARFAKEALSDIKRHVAKLYESARAKYSESAKAKGAAQ